jgi:hypothetical protein
VLGSGADNRPACGLHTHKLWQSHADPNGDTDGNSHSDTNTYSHSHSHSYSNSYAYTDSYAYGNSDSYCYTDAYFHTETNPDAKRYGFAKAATDPAASAVGPGSQVINEK